MYASGQYYGQPDNSLSNLKTITNTQIKSQLPSLKVRRMRTIALESFKILNNLSPAYLNDLFTVKIILIILGTRKQLKFHR